MSTEPIDNESTREAAAGAPTATKADGEVRLSDGRLMPIRDAPSEARRCSKA